MLDSRLKTSANDIDSVNMGPSGTDGGTIGGTAYGSTSEDFTLDIQSMKEARSTARHAGEALAAKRRKLHHARSLTDPSAQALSLLRGLGESGDELGGRLVSWLVDQLVDHSGDWVNQVMCWLFAKD